MKYITDASYRQTKRVLEDVEIQNVSKCHDLYVQSNTVLLDDVFKNF